MSSLIPKLKAFLDLCSFAQTKRKRVALLLFLAYITYHIIKKQWNSRSYNKKPSLPPPLKQPNKTKTISMSETSDNNQMITIGPKHNEYDKIDLNTFWGIYGKKIKINGTIVTYNGSDRGHNSIYSSLPMSKGIHKIKLKVLEESSFCTIGIGITSTTNYKNDWCFGENKGTYNYGYDSRGCKYSHEHGGVLSVSSYDINDIIVIILDFNNLILSFDKNNKNIYKINIKKHKYYFAISMGGYGGKASIEIV